MTLEKTPLALALAALLALGGCTGGTEDAGGEATRDVTLEEPAGLAGDEGEFDDEPSEEPADRPALTAAVLGGLERGLVRENEGLQAALDKLASADTDAGRLIALGNVDIEAIEAAAAEAAGVSPGDYTLLKEHLFDVLGRVDMHEMMTAIYSDMDDAELDGATRAEVEKGRDEMMADLEDPFEGMDDEAIEAFKARQARLAELRAQNIGLLLKFLGG